MRRLILGLVVCSLSSINSLSLLAQTAQTSKDLQLTPAEKFKVELKHDHLLAKRLALIQAQSEAEEAAIDFNNTVKEVMSKREGYTLCGGPQPGICDSAPDNDIILRKNPDNKDNKKDKTDTTEKK